MKTALLIPMHSVADVVTNSSSELFVCNTSQTAEQIMSLIGAWSAGLGEHHGVGSVKVGLGSKDLKDIVMNELDGYMGRGDFAHLLRQFVPKEDMAQMEMPVIRSVWGSYDSNMEWDERRKQMQVVDEENKASIETFFERERPILDRHIKQFCVISSQEDNSIPYEMFDIIEGNLNAVRFHLG